MYLLLFHSLSFRFLSLLSPQKYPTGITYRVLPTDAARVSYDPAAGLLTVIALSPNTVLSVNVDGRDTFSAAAAERDTGVETHSLEAERARLKEQISSLKASLKQKATLSVAAKVALPAMAAPLATQRADLAEMIVMPLIAFLIGVVFTVGAKMLARLEAERE